MWGDDKMQLVVMGRKREISKATMTEVLIYVVWMKRMTERMTDGREAGREAGRGKGGERKA